MLMLLERRGYNSRAARVSEKKVSQGWRNSKYKVMPKGIGYGFMRKHSGLLGQAMWNHMHRGSIKEKGGGVNVLVPFHLRSHFGQSRPPIGVITPLQPELVTQDLSRQSLGKSQHCLEVVGGSRNSESG